LSAHAPGVTLVGAPLWSAACRVASWVALRAAPGLMLVAALLIGLLATLDASRAQSVQPVPALAARVTDLAGALDAAERGRIEAELADLERRTGAQVAVLIVRTTVPEDIAAYGIRVVEAWKLGRASVDGKPVDDGVLLLVALDDRRMRIEVGRGLEGALPDAVARRIIAERIAPRFREQAYAEGIAQGVAEIARRIEGESLPAPAAATDDQSPDLIFVLIAGLFAGLAVSARLGRLPGGLAGGLVAAGFGLSQGMSAIAAAAAGAGVLVVVLVMLAAGGRGGGAVGSGGRRGGPRGPVWTDGGGWGASGGSSGGYSGGGGSFGGGGASGDW